MLICDPRGLTFQVNRDFKILFFKGDNNVRHCIGGGGRVGSEWFIWKVFGEQGHLSWNHLDDTS